jgi:hypothetical protein
MPSVSDKGDLSGHVLEDTGRNIAMAETAVAARKNMRRAIVGLDFHRDIRGPLRKRVAQICKSIASRPSMNSHAMP